MGEEPQGWSTAAQRTWCAPRLPGEGAARLALESPPRTSWVLPSCGTAPHPPRLLTQQALRTLRPFLHTEACICVFLGDCFLITLWNNKSWLGTQVTSSDEPSDHQNLGTAPGQGATKTASVVLAATWSNGAPAVPALHVCHVGALGAFL